MFRSAAVVVLCAFPAAAQAPLVSPSFYADIEGQAASTAPLAVGRSQQIHGDLRGAAFVLRGIGLRRNGIGGDDPRYAARSIVVELRVGDSDLASVAAAFTGNYVGAPTIALPRATIQLPDRSARPVSRPAPIDARLPFAQPFAYAGIADLVWEAIVTRAPTTPYPNDVAISGSTQTPSSSRFLGSGCVTGGEEFRFEVTADTASIGGRPQVTWVYQGFGVPAASLVGIAFGLGDPDLALPGVCGRLRVNSFFVQPVTRQAGGVFRAIQATPFAAAPVGQPFEMQAVAANPGVALSNGVTIRVNPPAPRFPISRVLAADPAALRGTVSIGRAVVVEFAR